MIGSFVKPRLGRFQGLAALGGAMTYAKPEVRDFGSIADHTYTVDSDDGFPGYSCVIVREL